MVIKKIITISQQQPMRVSRDFCDARHRLMYKSLSGQTPQYLADDVQLVVDMQRTTSAAICQ